MKRPLLLAVLCGACAMLFTALYLVSLEKTYRQGAEKVKVIVARQRIDQGTTISAALLEERVIPKEYLQPRAVQSVKELADSEGRLSYIAVAPIERGEQVVTTKLSLLGVDTGISSIIPTDRRALTLAFDSEEVAGLVKPGNRVDIVGVFEYRDKEDRQQEESVCVLQNILVLSVGKSFLGSVQAEGKKGNGFMTNESESGRIPVSFAVTPRQAEVLSLAAEKSRLRLSLRPIGDDEIFEFEAVKIQDISKNIRTAQTVKETPGIPEEYVKEMQKKQKEAMEILRKYRKD
ncbi:MAG: Flp pilus assembly protein CpaB [Endomicrobiales bacterium]